MFVGSDTEQLLNTSKELTDVSDQLSGLVVKMSQRADGLLWEAPDAVKYLGIFAPLRDDFDVVADLVGMAAVTLKRTAEAQDTVSSTFDGASASKTSAGSVTAGAISGGSPVSEALSEPSALQGEAGAGAFDTADPATISALREDLEPAMAYLGEDEASKLRNRLENLTDHEHRVLGLLLRNEVSAFDLSEFLKGGHVRLEDPEAYSILSSSADRRNRFDSNCHYKGQAVYPGTTVYGVETEVLVEVLFGRRPDGSTWVQLEEYPADGPIDYVNHGYEYDGSGRSQGPYGSSPYTDQFPMTIRDKSDG